MSKTEKLVGYDCREMYLPYLQVGLDHVQSMLLRSDIIKPLSISPLIWHSLFRSPSNISVERDLKCRYTPCLPHDDAFATTHNFWNDLGEMRSIIMKSPEALKLPAWIVAFTVVETELYLNEVNSSETNLPFPIQDNPFVMPNGWVKLGYDVREKYLGFVGGLGTLSGDLVEQEEQKSIWGNRLNRYHLFRHQDDALLYNRHLSARMQGIIYLTFGLYIVHII
jgi:hypothetical protein